MRVEGLTFRVQGLGFRVQGSGLRIEGLGFTVQGLGFKGAGRGETMHVECRLPDENGERCEDQLPQECRQVQIGSFERGHLVSVEGVGLGAWGLYRKSACRFAFGLPRS